MKLLFYSVLFVFINSCGESNLKKVERLQGFRILGVKTSTPEVNPGDTISDIQVFFSDPQGGGRIIAGTTVACVDPGISFGAEVDCDHDPAKVTGTYSINTIADDDSVGQFTGLSSSTSSVTVPSLILTGKTTREQFNGVGYIIIFTFTVDGKEEKAFKKILVSTRPVKNNNPGTPTASILLKNGSAIALPNQNESLVVSSSSQESFEFMNISGTKEVLQENFQVAWYVSNGEFDKPKSSVNEDVKYQKASAQSPFTLVAVIRDERGGIEFLQFSQ